MLATFDKYIILDHKQTPKIYLTDGNNNYGTQHIKSFMFLAVLIYYSENASCSPEFGPIF